MSKVLSVMKLKHAKIEGHNLVITKVVYTIKNLEQCKDRIEELNFVQKLRKTDSDSTTLCKKLFLNIFFKYDFI